MTPQPHLYSLITVTSVPARQHGPARGGLEGLQQDGGHALQEQGQRLHEEQGRLRPAPPLLPERPQRVLPDPATQRLQTRPEEQRE